MRAPRSRSFRALLGAAALLPIVLLGVLVRDVRAADDHRRGADAKAAEAAAALPARQDRRAEALLALAAADAELAVAVQELLDLVAERDAATADLDAMAAELLRLESAAGGAEIDAWVAASRVRALGECLDGVSGVLNRVAVGDVTGARRTLEALETSCEIAAELQ